MRNVGIIMRRELASYFATPIAYVFILISPCAKFYFV